MRSFVHVPNVMSEEEMREHVDPWYHSFLRREIEVRWASAQRCGAQRVPRVLPAATAHMVGCCLVAQVPGADLCDMSGAKGRSPDEFTVYNVMLPRTYNPAQQGNLFEQRCKVGAATHSPCMHALSWPLAVAAQWRTCRARVPTQEIADQLHGGDMAIDYDQASLGWAATPRCNPAPASKARPARWW